MRMVYFAKHSSRTFKSTVSYLIYEHDRKDGLIEAFGYPVMDTVRASKDTVQGQVKPSYALSALFCPNYRITR